MESNLLLSKIGNVNVWVYMQETSFISLSYAQITIVVENKKEYPHPHLYIGRRFNLCF